MKALLKILSELHPEANFEDETALVDDGILDSLDIVTLITEINQEYDISIPAQEITPENFNSVEAIIRLIKKIDEA
ncbi:MAG TPA: acyl carrier protein [Clostridiales bacterium]|jgi:D-alanine--poly(phosphoribitol) ligase subunit 2|nr:acyl carrier protein [Clostridiales bacterium]